MSTPGTLPPELAQELSLHTGGQELVHVWELLAIAEPATSDSGTVSVDAAAAWSSLLARIAPEAADEGAEQVVIATPLAPSVAPSAPNSAVIPISDAPSVRRPTGSKRAPAAPLYGRRVRAFAPLGLAAAVAAVMAVGAWQSRAVTETAPAGGQLVVSLPDGSSAELNAGSSLTYRRGFRRFPGIAGTRAVALNGEAYFSVTKRDRPFTVSTDEATVTVLGTRFLVRGHRADSVGTTVAVEEGRVRVAAIGSAVGAVELTAGEGTSVGDASVAPTSVSAVGVERLTLWRRGGLAFVDQPLSAIFRELERRYAVDIRLRDVTVGDERISVYYSDRPSIELVLTDLCTSGGLRFTRTSRGFEITPAAESSTTSP